MVTRFEGPADWIHALYKNIPFIYSQGSKLRIPLYTEVTLYYLQLIERKQQAVGVATQPGKQTEMDKEFKTTVNDLRHSTTVLARGLKQSPVSASTLEKVQSDR